MTEDINPKVNNRLICEVEIMVPIYRHKEIPIIQARTLDKEPKWAI